jgi:hypothetical protein
VNPPRNASTTSSRLTRRHGFTLLELTLAATLGLLVLIGVITLMWGFESTNQRLARRFEGMTDLQRVRLVAGRAFSTMLVAPNARATQTTATATDATGDTQAQGDQARAAGEATRVRAALAGANASTGAKDAWGSGKDAESGKSSGSASKSSSERAAARGAGDVPGASGTADGARAARTTPRVWLQLGSPVAAAQFREVPITISEGTQARRTMTQPQRLELVLSSSPVPQTENLRAQIRAVQLETARESRRRDRDTTKAAPGNAPGPGDGITRVEDDAEDTTPTRAIRGAFELRPMVVTGSDGRPKAKLLENGNPLWDLFWVPLPPRPAEFAGSPEELLQYEELRREAERTGSLGDEFKIASDIAWMRWQMFQDRVRRLEYAGTTWSELPAYVELEIETANGMTGNWLFEVSADQGLETPAEEGEPDRSGTGSRAAGARGTDGTGLSPNAGAGTGGKGGAGSGKPAASGPKAGGK